MKLIGHESPFTLPAGSYYLGDPCYVLDEDEYTVLMELRWGNSNCESCDSSGMDAYLIRDIRKLGDESINKRLDLLAIPRCYPSEPLLIDFGKRGTMLTWQTAHGDGRYKMGAAPNGPLGNKVQIPDDGLAVDSGQLAFVDVRLMRKGLKRSRKTLSDYSGTVVLAKPLKVRIEGGDMKARGLRVITS